MFTLVFCLQTTKRNEPAPHSDAFVDQRLLSLTLYGMSTALNCAITTVQYRHVVRMARCDWPFTVGYIIICDIHMFSNLVFSCVLFSILMLFALIVVLHSLLTFSAKL